MPSTRQLKRGDRLVVIVEGADSSGKTTLAKQLSEHFGVPVEHDLGPVGHDKMLDWMFEQIQEVGDSEPDATFIYDRWPSISEEVYGPILRGGSEFFPVKSRMAVNEIWNFLENHSHLALVYCRPPRATVEYTVNNEEHIEGVRNNLISLVDRYDEVITELASKGTWYTQYDWTIPNSFNELLSVLELRRGTQK